MSHLRGESLKIILIILLGWSCFTFGDTIAKHLTQNHSPALILTLGSVITVFSIILWILYDRGWRGFLSPNWKWLVARGITVAILATSVVNAFSLAPMADVYGITFSAPFIAVVMAYLILKEQVGWHRWLSVIVGFIGVFILLGPQFNDFNKGIMFAIIAAIATAVGTIIIRKIGNKEYLPLFILYPYIGIILVNAPMIDINISVSELPNLSTFLAYIIFILVAQLCITYGTAHAKSTASVAPFVYVQLIWGVIFGYFIFNDIPTLPTIAGLSLIVGAGLFMIYREQKLNKKTS